MKTPNCERHGIDSADQGAPLENVYHVCHLEEAMRIFQDGRIRPWSFSVRPVRSLIRICFLSANRFDLPGSVFGHVSFCFSWRRVIRGKKLFCVEPYNDNTFRILLAKNRYKLPRLTVRRNAPVIYDVGTRMWYWNFRKTSQFALEASLPLKDCARVDFVTHGGSRCIRSSGATCEYPAIYRYDVGAKLLAALLSRKPTNEYLSVFVEDGRLTEGASKSWKRLVRSLTRAHCSGTLRSSDVKARKVLRRALNEFGNSKAKTARKLCKVFRNTGELRKSLEAIAAKGFRVPVSELP